MMLSPEVYIDGWKEATYEELMEERDGLAQLMKDYEEREATGDPSSEVRNECPTPDVVYSMSLLYLSELSRLMYEKYTRDYIWGDHSLRDDLRYGVICRPGGDQKETGKH